MARRFRIAGGVAAIWEGAGDTLPFLNPLGYLSRLKFHSDIDYVRIINSQTYTLTVPASGAVPSKVANYVLGPHGIAGQPFVVPYIRVNGIWVAFTGHVPVHQFVRSYGDSYARFLSCGVDATNIIVHEYSVQEGSSKYGFDNRPAQTFQVKVDITDIIL